MGSSCSRPKPEKEDKKAVAIQKKVNDLTEEMSSVPQVVFFRALQKASTCDV